MDLSCDTAVISHDLPSHYYALGDASFHEGNTEDNCTKAGLRYGAWKLYQQHILKEQLYTIQQFRNLTFTEWRECVLTLCWKMSKVYRLHFECVAVAIAYQYLNLGNRIINFIQGVVGTDPTGEIDYRTKWAILRHAPTREMARDFAVSILRWRPGMHHMPPAEIPEGDTPLHPDFENTINSLDLTMEEKKGTWTMDN